MQYTAITIGPIFRTMQIAESSKAIWSASYLFSYIMKQIYAYVEKEVGEKNIILPYADDSLMKEKLKAGLFPDRIIFIGKLTDFKTKKSEIINDLATLIANDIAEDFEHVQKYLSNYLVINCVEKDLSESDNAVDIMNEYLDTSELFQKTNPYVDKSYLSDFLEMKISGYNTFIKDEFGEQPVPSINQIATAKLKHMVKSSRKEDDNFYDNVKKEKPEELRNFHKYIAIVQADGDNFGKFNKALYALPKEIRHDYIVQLSKNLTKFSKASLKIVRDWSGVPIYAGGDDLLFFAPIADIERVEMQKSDSEKADGDKTESVKCTVKEDIFDVVNCIDAKFNELFTEYNIDGINFESVIKSLNKKPSMSYGISISYYKFPLDQALDNAYSMLKEAKKGNKNAVSLQIIKHSGQAFYARFDKTDNSYEELKKLYSGLSVNNDFISGFMYKLHPLTTVLKEIALEQDEGKRNNRIDAFFENFFDEDIHKKQLNDEDSFLKKVRKLIQKIYTEQPLTNENADKQHKINLDKLYSGLRFYQFINAKDEK